MIDKILVEMKEYQRKMLMDLDTCDHCSDVTQEECISMGCGLCVPSKLIEIVEKYKEDDRE